MIKYGTIRGSVEVSSELSEPLQIQLHFQKASTDWLKSFGSGVNSSQLQSTGAIIIDTVQGKSQIMNYLH